MTNSATETAVLAMIAVRISPRIKPCPFISARFALAEFLNQPKV
jgi:hypothetical protein